MYSVLAALFNPVFSSLTIIFLSRFMLNLRGVYLKTEPGEITEGYMMSEPRFAENLVGNLGAPLQTGYIPSSLFSADSSESKPGFDYVDDGASDDVTEVSADPLSVGIGVREEVEMKNTGTAAGGS